MPSLPNTQRSVNPSSQSQWSCSISSSTAALTWASWFLVQARSPAGRSSRSSIGRLRSIYCRGALEAVPHISRYEDAGPGVVIRALRARHRRRTALALAPAAGRADRAAPLMAAHADPDVLGYLVGVLVAVE